jgi:hypothetical protein
MTTVINQPGVVDGIVVEAGVVFAPGYSKWHEPVGMRPANLRMAGDRIGEYHLSDGSIVWATWMPTSKTHTDIWLWDAGDYQGFIRNVVRTQAARATERALRKLEER